MTSPNLTNKIAHALIEEELERQDKMWGAINERADASKAQLLAAAYAQVALVSHKQVMTSEDALSFAKEHYPKEWSGFRDYGSDVANMVVAIAYLTNEIRRRIRADESFHRANRRPDQPYSLATGLPNA